MSDEKLEMQKAKAQQTLSTMLNYLGLEATLRIEEKNNRLAIKISSNEAGRIIGRKGQTLESLQLLLNRIMFKGEEECPRIVLDIDGYGRDNTRPEEGAGEEGDGDDDRQPRRERRDRRDRDDRGPRGDRRERGERGEHGEHGSGVSEEQLVQQALDAAKEVKKWGDPVSLPKMNAHDRRIIHITLQDDPELVTESEGEGSQKKVVITLKKA